MKIFLTPFDSLIWNVFILDTEHDHNNKAIRSDSLYLNDRREILRHSMLGEGGQTITPFMVITSNELDDIAQAFHEYIDIKKTNEIDFKE